jgi:hypothetical protein
LAQKEKNTAFGCVEWFMIGPPGVAGEVKITSTPNNSTHADFDFPHVVSAFTEIKAVILLDLDAIRQ